MTNRINASKAITPLLLQPSEIPERLAINNTWNCSKPHWLRLQRHFRCNLRQECASGEDEAWCPYSPCEHGGVSFYGHCYFLVEKDVKVSWLQAQEECRDAGAYLASLATYREWTDVMKWLHLAISWLLACLKRPIFLGVTLAPDGLPHLSAS